MIYQYHLTLLQFAYLVKKIVTDLDLDPLHLSGCCNKWNHCQADMIKKIADLVNDKKLEGISTIRDESDRNGMRIVFVLKRDAIPNIVLNKLFKYSPLQSSFSVNNIALVNGRPQMLNLKDMIKHFVDHRHDVVVRRT